MAKFDEPGQDVLDAAAQTQIIHSLIEKLQACYIFPDIAEKIAVCLQKHLQDGDYVDLYEGDMFALALTMHAQEANHDEHLWIKWHAEPLPEDEGPLRLNHAWQEQRRQEASLDNFGLHRVERLPGNVGFIDIRHFHRPEWGGNTACAAMNFIANANALIIDLRQCTGGYPGMIALILSYLFEETPIHLDSIYWRDDDLTQQYWTLPYVPGRRFAQKPVFVLTSKITFSGGEQFAYILQTRQRATLVGEKTDGGAHPGASYRIHPNFEAFIPIGIPINPLSGTNWEGCGVAPDIVVTEAQAYPAAYRLALEAALVSLGEVTSGPCRALAEEIQMALKSLEIS